MHVMTGTVVVGYTIQHRTVMCFVLFSEQPSIIELLSVGQKEKLMDFVCTDFIIIIIIIINNEFHRDASLKQNLKKTSEPLCVTCCTSVNATVAGGVRCYGFVVTAGTE